MGDAHAGNTDGGATEKPCDGFLRSRADGDDVGTGRRRVVMSGQHPNHGQSQTRRRNSKPTTVPVGDEPHGVRTDPAGKTIYVLNTSSDDISVIDAATLQEQKRLAASRSPWAAPRRPTAAACLSPTPSRGS